jgi:hypothetical protein
MPTPEQRAAVDAEMAQKADPAFTGLVKLSIDRAKLRTFELPNRPLPERGHKET